jgi:hypothetical protein
MEPRPKWTRRPRRVSPPSTGARTFLSVFVHGLENPCPLCPRLGGGATPSRRAAPRPRPGAVRLRRQNTRENTIVLQWSRADEGAEISQANVPRSSTSATGARTFLSVFVHGLENPCPFARASEVGRRRPGEPPLARAPLHRAPQKTKHPRKHNRASMEPRR